MLEGELADLLEKCGPLRKPCTNHSNVISTATFTSGDGEDCFALEHAANKGVGYIDGYEEGLRKVQKAGQEEGKYKTLYSKSYICRDSRIGKKTAKEDEENVRKRAVKGGSAEEAQGTHASSDAGGGDCSCFYSGFRRGYCDAHNIVYMNARCKQEYVVGYSYAYANRYWYEHHNGFLLILASHGTRVSEALSGCTSAYARAYGVGFLAGSEAGRAKQFSLVDEGEKFRKAKVWIVGGVLS